MRWIVAECETQQRGHVARQLLMRASLETYWPVIKQHGRVVPMFGCYVFVRIPGDQWYSVRWSIGIRQLLMSGDRPATLRDDVVESIKGREVGGVVVLPRAPRLRPGQKVKVIHGSFEGMVGIYSNMIGLDRERILLDILGRQTAVILHTRHVAAC
jgi:transcription antitermination factor NusG